MIEWLSITDIVLSKNKMTEWVIEEFYEASNRTINSKTWDWPYISSCTSDIKSLAPIKNQPIHDWLPYGVHFLNVGIGPF